MKPATIIFIGLALFLLFVVAGCSNREETTILVHSGTGNEQAGDTSQAAAVLPGQGTVQIVPASPTTLDDLRAVASGVSGKLTYRWEVNDSAVSDVTTALLPHAQFVKGDRVSLVLEVNSQELGAKTIIRNTPPEVVSVSVVPNGFYRGIDLNVATEGWDADSDEITYTYTWLINDEEQSFETSATLPGNLFQRDDRIVLSVTPSDSEDLGSPFRTGEMVVANAPPYFVSSPPQGIDSMSYRYAVQARDPDDDSLRFRLDLFPSGMTINDKTGLIEWEITPDHSGENTVRIVVSDSEGAETAQEFSINLSFAD